MASQEHVGWERVRFIAKSLPLLKSQEFERLVFLVNINSLAGQHFFSAVNYVLSSPLLMTRTNLSAGAVARKSDIPYGNKDTVSSRKKERDIETS